MNQYEMAHRAAGIIDRALRGTLMVGGRDRGSWLQGLLTNDIGALTAGRGCYSAWLTPQGRMITDMVVLELGDRIVLDVPVRLATVLAERFERLIFAEDVTIQDASGSLDLFRILGPQAAGTLATAINGDTVGPLGSRLAEWIEYQNAEYAVRDSAVIVARNDEFGVPGYDVYEIGTSLRRKLQESGTPVLDESIGETLRIEAGRPLFGVDMDHDTIPLEAGIEDRAISFSKGCYVGQEVIVRVTSRGHGRVVKKLVGLLLDGERVPKSGEPVFGDRREIGRVTSGVKSPALGKSIALAYVHRDFVEPGSRVVIGGESAVGGVVTELPFINSSAQRTNER